MFIFTIARCKHKAQATERVSHAQAFAASAVAEQRLVLEADVECVSETICLEIDGLQESNRCLRELQSSTTDELAVQKKVVQRLEAELRQHITESALTRAQHAVQSLATGLDDEVQLSLDRIAQELAVSRRHTLLRVFCARK